MFQPLLDLQSLPCLSARTGFAPAVSDSRVIPLLYVADSRIVVVVESVVALKFSVPEAPFVRAPVTVVDSAAAVKNC